MTRQRQQHGSGRSGRLTSSSKCRASHVSLSAGDSLVAVHMGSCCSAVHEMSLTTCQRNTSKRGMDTRA
jgi:hypothetical protein